MTDAHDSPEAETQDTAAAPGSAPAVDELAVLEQLESDLAAVETAIATIDQIGAGGMGGEQAATEIAAAVGLLAARAESDPTHRVV